MRHHVKFIVFAVIALLHGYSHAMAQSTTGRYLLLKPSAVSMSMGGTGVAYDHSPFAAYSNVAGLAFLPSINIAGSLSRPLPFFDNVRQSYLTGSLSFPSFGTLAVSANLHWKGTQIVSNSSGSAYHSDEKPMDWHLKLSYARAFSEDLSAGISVGALRLDVSDIGTEQSKGTGQSTSFLLDAGVMYRNLLPSATFIRGEEDLDAPFASVSDRYSPTGLSLGLALSNLGPKVTILDDQQADPPPGTLTLGVAYSPVRTSPLGFMLALDAEKELYDASIVNYLHWGGELTVLKLIALRAGYFQDTSGPTTSYWAWGAGLKFYFLHLNVARYTRALLPSWHFDGAFIWELYFNCVLCTIVHSSFWQ